MKKLLTTIVLLAIILVLGSCSAPRAPQKSHYLPFAPTTSHKTIKRMNAHQVKRAYQGYTLYSNRNRQVKRNR